jgi:hypothetical protein
MARIKKDLVTQREAEVVEAFRAGATPRQANEALALKYNMKMGLPRLYALRAQVKAEIVAITTITPDVVVESPPQ